METRNTRGRREEREQRRNTRMRNEDDGDKLREEVLCLPRFYNRVTFSIKKDVKQEKKRN